MAYICTKPKGSCGSCPHYRYDDDYGAKACFAQKDTSDLISRKMLENALTVTYQKQYAGKANQEPYTVAWAIMRKQPGIEAVPVVRCKNCKHNVANRTPDPLDNTDYTDITCDYFMTDGMSGNDFCSRAEPISTEGI